jgi:hypothetical protein
MQIIIIASTIALVIYKFYKGSYYNVHPCNICRAMTPGVVQNVSTQIDDDRY